MSFAFTSHFSCAALAVLGALVFLAGFIDALAGGGGLVTLPAYLALGLNPRFLLGTNKLSSSLGTAAACLKYNAHLKLRQTGLPLYIIITLCGSAAGAFAATLLDPGFVRYILIFGLPPVAVFVLRNSNFGAPGSVDINERQRKLRLCAIACSVGFYDGFFGPGTGTFLAICFTRFAGLELVEATVSGKYLNLASNISALGWFIAVGRVDIGLGLLMGVCGIGGNWLGAHAGVKKGGAVIRPMLAAVCVGLLVKIVWDLHAH